MKITFGNVFIKLDSVHLKDVALMKFSFVYITNMCLRLPLQIHYWHVLNTGIVPTSYSERMFSWFPVYIPIKVKVGCSTLLYKSNL